MVSFHVLVSNIARPTDNLGLNTASGCCLSADVALANYVVIAESDVTDHFPQHLGGLRIHRLCIRYHLAIT